MVETTIRISKETRKKLFLLKKDEKETYEQVIQRLIFENDILREEIESFFNCELLISNLKSISKEE